jgi:C-terminal processing protease CtpA/Prc
LHGGDLITAIDGHPIAAGDRGHARAGDEGEDDAVRQARSLLANLKENQPVRIDYLRGAQKGVVTLNAERRQALNWPALMNEDPEHPFLPKDFNERIRADVERARDAQREAMRDPEVQREIARAKGTAAEVRRQMNSKEMRDAMADARHAMRRAMPWWGLNLAPVNADLGRYFGTDKGALVIAADNAALPGLRAGDVIVGVAGATVERPEDVMRALRDEPAGQDIELKLMRERKRIALAVKAPAFKSIFEVAPPLPPMPPTPPAAPVPPLAPAPTALPVPVPEPAPAPPAPPAPPAR